MVTGDQKILALGIYRNTYRNARPKVHKFDSQILLETPTEHKNSTLTKTIQFPKVPIRSRKRMEHTHKEKIHPNPQNNHKVKTFTQKKAHFRKQKISYELDRSRKIDPKKPKSGENPFE